MTAELAPIEVSVLILTYNQENTIARAIESVLRQRTTFGVEIIIADDCSTDSTGLICRRYAAEYPDKVRLVPRESNIGVVRSYFECLGLARGAYIADCAGDDYWLGDDTLQLRYDMLVSDPGLSMVHADWAEVSAGRPGELHDPFGGVARYAPVTEGRELLPRLLEHRMPVTVHLSTALYRADIVRGLMARDAAAVCRPDYGCEDLPVLAALLASGRVGYLHRLVLAYTVGGDSVSNPSRLRRAFDFYEGTARCTLDMADRYGVDRRRLRRWLARRREVLTSIAWRLSDRTLADRADAVDAPVTVKTALRRMLMPLRLMYTTRASWSK